MKKYLLILLSQLSLLQPAISQPKVKADSVLDVANKVAKWQLREWQEHGKRHPAAEWTMGACYAGYMDLAKVAYYSTYLDDMKAIGDSLRWQTGPRHTMADDYCVAQMYCQMYLIYKQPEMIKQWKAQADSIISLPHTESLEWKNNIASREWAWCDALFMGPPAFAYLSAATKDLKYLDAACKLWWKTTGYLYDKDENLYYRDSRFFTQKEANGKKVFWSRGNGWVMGGLVRMLDNMPDDYPERPKFIDLYKKMAAKIASLQNPDGTWHAALLDPASYPAKESSGTGFYCYALAYGINHGLLPYRKYHAVVEKAWRALTGCVQPDGKLGYVQQIGEKPEKVTADDTEVYGAGAFLLAGSEVYKMVRDHH
ncbi:MAG TPA: glycoside hydrolase family 88 protein [Mucilaginibacter sp.]|nr:glycoside hydrolase family 88 protein [Mucilaginibacter sp.]